MQPLGYPSLTDEQKARAAALMLASEVTSEQDPYHLTALATFIIDGAGGVIGFGQMVAPAQKPESTGIIDTLFKGLRVE